MELSLSQARPSLRSHPSSSDSLADRRKYFKSHHVRLSNFSVTTTLKQGQSNYLSFVLKKNTVKVFCSQKSQTPVLEARSIEEVYDSLAERLLLSIEKLQDHNSKYIIGLAGSPGAGKSTLASEVVCLVNTLSSQNTMKINASQAFDIATVLPMDGFHLYRSQLDAMENPKEAHARRGAPWTFNPELLLKRLHALRSEGSVHVPSFDHGVGDPVEDDIFIRPESHMYKCKILGQEHPRKQGNVAPLIKCPLTMEKRNVMYNVLNMSTLAPQNLDFKWYLRTRDETTFSPESIRSSGGREQTEV